MNAWIADLLVGCAGMWLFILGELLCPKISKVEWSHFSTILFHLQSERHRSSEVIQSRSMLCENKQIPKIFLFLSILLFMYVCIYLYVFLHIYKNIFIYLFIYNPHIW